MRVYLIGLQIWYLSDAERLKEALASTGGQYFDVQDEKQLQQAYKTIDALERQDLITERYARNVPYYQPFISGALILLTCVTVLKMFRFFIPIRLSVVPATISRIFNRSWRRLAAFDCCTPLEVAANRHIRGPLIVVGGVLIHCQSANGSERPCRLARVYRRHVTVAVGRG